MGNVSQAVGWDANGKNYDYNLIGGDANNVNLRNSYDVPGYIPNQNKILHLCFYKIKDASLLLNNSLGDIIGSIGSSSNINGGISNCWDNWRDGKNTIDLGNDNNSVPALVVPDSVYPVLDNFAINGGFELGVTSATDVMKGGSMAILEGAYEAAANVAKFSEGINFGLSASADLLSTTKDKGIKAAWNSINSSNLAAKGADGALMKGSLTSRFDDFPVFNGSASKAIAPGEITLGFNIGCGNYFDGEVEVVRPIAAIENKIIPVIKPGDMNRIYGPMGSPAQFAAAVWGSAAGILPTLFSTAGRALSTAAEGIAGTVGAAVGGDTATGIRQMATTTEALGNLAYETQETVLRAKDAAVAAVSKYTTLLFMRLGNSVIGPFYIDKCSHKFDYSQVDEKGYPYKGTITLSVKYMLKPNNYDNLSQMGYITTSSASSSS